MKPDPEGAGHRHAAGQGKAGTGAALCRCEPSTTTGTAVAGLVVAGKRVSAAACFARERCVAQTTGGNMAHENKTHKLEDI